MPYTGLLDVEEHVYGLVERFTQNNPTRKLIRIEVSESIWIDLRCLQAELTGETFKISLDPKLDFNGIPITIGQIKGNGVRLIPEGDLSGVLYE